MWLIFNRLLPFILYSDAVRQHFTSFSGSVTTCQLPYLESAMCSCHTSQSRRDHFLPEALVGPGLAGPSASLCSAEQMSCHKECVMSSPNQRDWQCPVCLQPASFPVRTNCGHLFCAPCLISYWRHGSWLDAISCPLCRQKVSELCRLFNESRTDPQSMQVVGEIKDYNKRYSGAPRQVTDYLCDAPLILQLLVRSLSTMAGLVWLFVFRVILCCVGTVVSISSPSLEPDSSSSASSLGTDPSLCGLLGVLDDLVVVVLLLICVVNINQQMAPERSERSANATSSQRLMGWTEAELQ